MNQEKIQILSDYFEKQKVEIVSANLTKPDKIKNIQIKSSLKLQDILFLMETLQLKPDQLTINSVYNEGLDDSFVLLIWKEV